MVAIFYQNYNCDNYFSDLLNFGRNFFLFFLIIWQFFAIMSGIMYLYSFLGNNWSVREMYQNSLWNLCCCPGSCRSFCVSFGSQVSFRFFSSGLDLSRLDYQKNSKLIKTFCMKLFKLQWNVQIGFNLVLNWSWLVHIGLDIFFKLVQTCPNLSKLVQNCLKLSEIVQNSPSLLKLV